MGTANQIIGRRSDRASFCLPRASGSSANRLKPPSLLLLALVLSRSVERAEGRLVGRRSEAPPTFVFYPDVPVGTEMADSFDVSTLNGIAAQTNTMKPDVGSTATLRFDQPSFALAMRAAHLTQLAPIVSGATALSTPML